MYAMFQRYALEAFIPISSWNQPGQLFQRISHLQPELGILLPEGLGRGAGQRLPANLG